MDIGNRENAGEGMKILNRDVIKYIAMFTMLLNHTAHALMNPGTILYEVFEDIGFFTAPVMCFFLVEGFGYTRSRTKYGQRLIVFAALSQIPYMLALHENNLSVMFTLLCCFLILVGMERIVDPIVRVLICAMLVFATSAGDWAYIAPILTIFLYHSKGNTKNTTIGFVAAYAIFVPFQIQKYMNGVPGDWTIHAIVHGMLSGAGILAAAAVVLVLYNGQRAKRGRNFSKWFFYIFYPAHLTVLYLIGVYITNL